MASTTEEFKVESYNIDHNASRLTNPNSFANAFYKEWFPEQRMPHILEHVRKTNPDVLHLQELRKFVTKTPKGDIKSDSLTPAVDGLKALGYDVMTAKYNPSDMTFYYITAFRPEKFEVLSSFSYYLTKTSLTPTDHSLPKDAVTDNNFGDEWERSAFVVNVKCRRSGKYVSLVNVHLNISLNHRMMRSINETSHLIDAWEEMPVELANVIGEYIDYLEIFDGKLTKAAAVVGHLALISMGCILEIYDLRTKRAKNMLCGLHVDEKFNKIKKISTFT